ncbi:MAG: energy transducer TonB [Vicinamibacterales bacterium]
MTKRCANTTVGHLCVHVDGAHPEEVPFLFEQSQRRLPGAFSFSIAVHLLALVLVLVVIRYVPARTYTETEILRAPFSEKIVWLAEPGPGGGGGGGGNRMPEPSRKLEMPGKDRISVPAVKPQAIKLDNPKPTEDKPKLEQEVLIPAKTLASGTQFLPGAIEGTSTGISQGPGSGGGAGTGSGGGIGPGSGSGLGPGSGGGFGGGAYRPGSGIEGPQLVREVKPQYTADAMRHKVQGKVILECVVLPDGTVGDVQVIRSLDPVFGLDQEALKAARQWRFVPGTRQGEPVAVVVQIEMEFALR